MRDSRQVLHDLVVGRGAALRRTAFLLCGGEGGADDLLQEALARSLVRRVPEDPDGVEAYVRRVMINLSIDRARRARRWASAAPRLGDVRQVSDRADEISTRVSLMEALALLPPRQRACVVLYYYEDLAVAQIAEVLGCSQGTVKSQLHDARGLLLKVWTEAPGQGRAAVEGRLA